MVNYENGRIQPHFREISHKLPSQLYRNRGLAFKHATVFNQREFCCRHFLD